jgi:hypothetical protein
LLGLALSRDSLILSLLSSKDYKSEPLRLAEQLLWTIIYF